MKKIFYLAALVLFTTACCQNEKTSLMNPQDAILQNIQTRVSVRLFTDEPVSDEQVETLLRCAMSAPSAVNKQPWEFIVVRDRALLDSIGTRYPNTRISPNVSVAIVPCGNLQEAFEPQPDFWIHDVSAATENLLLAVHAIGLGAVWCGIYPDEGRVEGIQAILGLPRHIVPLCVVPVGYPAEQPEVKDKWRTEKIHYDRF